VWVNEGISVTTVIDAAIVAIEAVEQAVGVKDAHFEMLAIAADGEVGGQLTARAWVLPQWCRQDRCCDTYFVGGSTNRTTPN
jgi:limonene-1,2-epoxide hydrolase